MTVNGMISSWKQYYDKITNFSAPGYENNEILLFLNNSQDEFIKERMFGEKFMPPAFEDNQKRVADLRPLITGNIPGTFTTYSYLAKCKGMAIPADLMFIIGLSAVVTRTEPYTPDPEWVECDFIKGENAGKFNTTTYNKPYFKRPKYFVLGSVVYVIFDSYTTGYADANHKYNLQYIKKPTELVADEECDLETHTHQEIVDIAVRQALQVSQDPRFQSKLIEEKSVKTQ